MEKFGVQLGLEGLREARQEWAKRKREFDTGYHRVMAVLLHEAARNFMSVEQIAEFAGLSKVRVRSLMRMAGLNPRDGKRVLSDKAAKALVENADLMGIKPHEMDLLSPLAYLPMGDDLRHKLQEQTVSQVTELLENDENEAFYREHYADWDVHVLNLTVYVPSKGGSPEESLGLIREILDDAAFDIRVSGNPA